MKTINVSSHYFYHTWKNIELSSKNFVTWDLLPACEHALIFIHVSQTHSLARRLTSARLIMSRSAGLFQLTAPQGADIRRPPVPLTDKNFNSQPRRGLTLMQPLWLAASKLFQLTAPQGGWQVWSVASSHQYHFNSQSRKGADSNFSQKYCLDKIVFCIYFTYFY